MPSGAQTSNSSAWGAWQGIGYSGGLETKNCSPTSSTQWPQHVTAGVKMRSGGLPQLDPIALRIGDPAESTDTLHVLRFFGHVRSLGA
ncbi:MAG: hypothetical protein QOD24_4925 [Solirubrobacteraceae bacterium]|nr:hypothetical protein [Solirubrobacteraceae bacterium]